jgi:hypothetical protein
LFSGAWATRSRPSCRRGGGVPPNVLVAAEDQSYAQAREDRERAETDVAVDDSVTRGRDSAHMARLRRSGPPAASGPSYPTLRARRSALHRSVHRALPHAADAGSRASPGSRSRSPWRARLVVDARRPRARTFATTSRAANDSGNRGEATAGAERRAVFQRGGPDARLLLAREAFPGGLFGDRQGLTDLCPAAAAAPAVVDDLADLCFEFVDRVGEAGE